MNETHFIPFLTKRGSKSRLLSVPAARVVVPVVDRPVGGASQVPAGDLICSKSTLVQVVRVVASKLHLLSELSMHFFTTFDTSLHF